MAEDITLVFDEYTEQLLFCKYFIANKLNHNAEMGRCGENILIQELRDRFQMLAFVIGFVVVQGEQSPQCDILVCRKTMQRRQLEGGLFPVNPRELPKHTWGKTKALIKGCRHGIFSDGQESQK